MSETPSKGSKPGGIKLKLSTTTLQRQASVDDSASVVPASTTSSAPRIKFTSKAKPANSAAPSSPAVPSPRLKLTSRNTSIGGNGLKRPSENEDSEDSPAPAPKKLKLKLNTVKLSKPSQSSVQTPLSTPFLKLKVKKEDKEKYKKKMARPKGYAYDSEADDRELDPVQHWNFILRMPPGDDADWVRTVVEARKVEEQGDGLQLRFLVEDGRRAIVKVRHKFYAAVLVDMPCIIESMKGWDKKGWWKSADIHQMLLVLGVIKSEEEAMNYPLPKGEINETTWQYAHGLTPPMHWVRKRRFRPRISTHAIQNIEEQVKRLLERDAEAVGPVKYSLIDKNLLRQQKAQMQQQLDEDQPESEYGYEDEEEQEEEVQDAAPEVDAEMEADFESFFDTIQTETVQPVDVAETPASSAAAPEHQEATDSEAQTPAANDTASKATSDDDEEDDDDDEEEEDGSEGEKEDVGQKREREEIDELKVKIREQHAEMDKISNPLLIARIKTKIGQLQADLEMKKAAAGIEDDDD